MIENNQTFQRRIKEQSSDEIQPPYYKLNPNMCARYATLAAKNLFDEEYKTGNAWNMRYSNKIAHPLKNKEKLTDLIIDNILRPGMIIGAEQPRSKYKGVKDSQGNKAEYTHVLLYVGLNDNKQPEFIHQFGRRIEKITEKDFEKRKLTPKEIITTKEDKNYIAQIKELKDNLKEIIN
jgi:hypothetical protein